MRPVSRRPSSFVPNMLNSDQIRRNYLRYRRKIISECLEIDKWQVLSQKIAAFQPDVLILLTPIMPRLHQILRLVDRKLLQAPLVITDLTLDYLSDNFLHNKKIALVDAAINVGSAFVKVRESLKRFSNTIIQCFAVYQRGSHDPKDVILADQKNLSLDEYRTNANYLAQTLVCLCRPFEVEFPIFYVNTPKKFDFNQFIIDVDKIPGLVANRQDDLESFPVGVNKFSIDVFPGRGVNDKWRFYFDMGEHRLFFVPMAHLNQNEDIPNKHHLSGTALYRYQMYCKSLVWGKECWDNLRYIANRPTVSLEHDEVRLLFGPDIAQEIISQFEQLPTCQRSLTPLPSQEEALYFYHAFKQKNIKIAGELFIEYLFNFFNELGLLVGEDDPSKYAFDDQEYYPQKEDVCKNHYLRLCVGPTFKELLLLMQPYFEKKQIAFTEEKLHTVMSKILDQQIDQGFIIPTFDAYGRRIFRKGQAFPYDRSKFLLIMSLGINVNFKNFQDKDIISKEDEKEIIAALEDFERELFTEE